MDHDYALFVHRTVRECGMSSAQFTPREIEQMMNHVYTSGCPETACMVHGQDRTMRAAMRFELERFKRSTGVRKRHA